MKAIKKTKFLTVIRVAQIWTTFRQSTIRRWAVQGKLPVATWLAGEPLFARNEKTLRALRRLNNASTK